MTTPLPSPAAADAFLELEAQASPQQLYDEVIDAMDAMAGMRNSRNKRDADKVWHTLLTCADFLAAGYGL